MVIQEMGYPELDYEPEEEMDYDDSADWDYDDYFPEEDDDCGCDHDEEDEEDEENEDDHEGSMAKSDLDSIAAMAAEINSMVGVDDELEGWVQAKITLAADYIEAVHRYLKHEY